MTPGEGGNVGEAELVQGEIKTEFDAPSRLSFCCFTSSRVSSFLPAAYLSHMCLVSLNAFPVMKLCVLLAALVLTG